MQEAGEAISLNGPKEQAKTKTKSNEEKKAINIGKTAG